MTCSASKTGLQKMTCKCSQNKKTSYNLYERTDGESNGDPKKKKTFNTKKFFVSGKKKGK
jgi:hypothetical protein